MKKWLRRVDRDLMLASTTQFSEAMENTPPMGLRHSYIMYRHAEIPMTV